MSAPFTVTIPGVGVFPLREGENLRAALRREGVLLDGACRDSGKCGRCVVRVTEGEAGDPFPAEAGLLKEQGLTGPGWRLACRVTPTTDLTVEIPPGRLLELDRAGRWKESWGSELWDPARYPLRHQPGRFALAVDLGTTSLAAAVLDLSTGEPAALASRANPHLPWGADILTRLQAAAEDPATAAAMREALRREVEALARLLCARAGISPGQVERGAAVGNSAVRALALGLPAGALLRPPFEPGARETLPWDIGLRVPLLLPPPLAAYVGSDALAALLAARPSLGESGALLDVGTNCEVVAWAGGRVLAASAPAGPSFEGGEISRGMRAEEGAVFRVRLTPHGVAAEVVGGGEARGVCGTGLVDAAAELSRLGLLDARGLMRAGAHPALSAEGLRLDPAGRVVVTGEDLASLQKAKAAVAAALSVLLTKLGVPAHPLPQGFTLVLAGAFGSRLDLGSAARIGLLPALPAERVTAAGNAALLGAAYAALSPQAMGELEALASSVGHLELSQDPSFEEAFLENLPLKGGKG